MEPGDSVLRILRAFVWLRWRLLLNALDRTGSRDTLARFSIAADSLAPIFVVLLVIPSALALAALAGYAGWVATREAARIPSMEAVRGLLAGGCLLAVLSPLLFPSRDRPNSSRLLLLPISRGVLYLAHVAAMLSHPIILLTGAVVVALPAGLAVGGRAGAAFVAAAAGLMLMGVLTGILVTVTSAAQLIVRDRRRGEWIALALFLLLPALGLLPALADGQRQDERASRSAERRPRELLVISSRVLRLVPSEPYVGAVRAAVHGPPRATGRALALLGGAAAAAHGVAYLLFCRVLATGGSNRRARAHARSAWWRIPGVPPAVSAVALNHGRLVLRTPRGRFALMSPAVVLLLFAAFSAGGTEVRLAFFRLESGLAVAIVTAMAAVLGTVPLLMNQFAIDGTGLARALLTPLETRALLVGKALGNAAAAALPAAVCAVGALAFFPAGDLRLWLCLPPAFASVIFLSTPAAAVLSALFPRRVDLGSISRGSNAHGAAGLLGALTIAGAAAWTALPVLAAMRLLHSPALAPVLLVGWSIVSGLICTALLPSAASIFERRRESILMMR